jgi:geranyl-CoA carboxylase beta subunit
VDEAALSALERRRSSTTSNVRPARSTASGKMLDDGVIDPRDTRKLLAMLLDICVTATADRRAVRPVQFGVARP